MTLHCHLLLTTIERVSFLSKFSNVWSPFNWGVRDRDLHRPLTIDFFNASPSQGQCRAPHRATFCVTFVLLTMLDWLMGTHPEADDDARHVEQQD